MAAPGPAGSAGALLPALTATPARRTQKLKPAKVLKAARSAAREMQLSIREIPGSGKGSHRIFAVYDSAGAEVGRFGLTGHNKEVSWEVLKHIESGLAPMFGEKWLEER